MSFGAYIHVPFCRRRCRYCDFYLTTNTRLTDKFVEALIEEIRLFSNESAEREIDSVFFGGGTPSLLDAGQIMDILNALRSNFKVSDDAEITLECNPEDISDGDDKLKKFKDAGVNRLSVGVQSFDDGELKFLTREHNGRDSVQALQNALKYFGNVSADIIYSIPGQTEKTLTANLETACSLGVPHVSAYTLIFEKGTLLFGDLSKNKVKQNTDETESALYHAANDFLKSSGYAHYEVSNYAKAGFESRHNLKYWNFGEYAGFGPSAHSFFGGKRWNNVRSVSIYNEIISEGKRPVENLELQTKEMLMTDYFICTLRSKGVNIGEFNKLFGANFEFEYRNEIRDNILSGYALIENGHFRLTEKGFAVADSITLQFVR